MGTQLGNRCGSRTTSTGLPCERKVGPGTTRCGAETPDGLHGHIPVPREWPNARATAAPLTSGAHVEFDDIVATKHGSLVNPGFGSLYERATTDSDLVDAFAHPHYLTPTGPVWIWRKGQRCRFYTADGEQVGPEQKNLGPAVAYAHHMGWTHPGAPALHDNDPAAPSFGTGAEPASAPLDIRLGRMPNGGKVEVSAYGKRFLISYTSWGALGDNGLPAPGFSKGVFTVYDLNEPVRFLPGKVVFECEHSPDSGHGFGPKRYRASQASRFVIDQFMKARWAELFPRMSGDGGSGARLEDLVSSEERRG